MVNQEKENIKTVKVYESEWRKIVDFKMDNDLPFLRDAVRELFKRGEEV